MVLMDQSKNQFDLYIRVNLLSKAINELVNKVSSSREIAPLVLIFSYFNHITTNDNVIYIYAPDEVRDLFPQQYWLEELLKITKPYETDFKIYYTDRESSLPYLNELKNYYFTSDIIPISKELKFYDFS